VILSQWYPEPCPFQKER